MRHTPTLAGLVSAFTLPLVALALLRAGRLAFDVPVQIDPFEIDLQLTERNDG